MNQINTITKLLIYARQGWQLEKTRLEKTRVLLLGFIGFFQDNLEKTQENWVFSRFCIFWCKTTAFFHKKLGFFMQNCIFSLQVTTKNSTLHIQICIWRNSWAWGHFADTLSFASQLEHRETDISYHELRTT